MSKVAKTSSDTFNKLEFIRSTDVFLSNPEFSSLLSIDVTIWLLLLASGPEPIPSLMAIKYFPSFSLVWIMLSPETVIPSFIAIE